MLFRSADPLPPKAQKTAPAAQNTSVSQKDSIPGTYYIIVKTNLPVEEANKLVATLTAEYPDAKVLTKDEKIRVSVFQSPDKALVTKRLKQVKQTYKDAWLLKR